MAKVAFVHRTLWQRDRTYRWAALLGPPPLIGVALAALVLQAIKPAALVQSGPWARWTRPVPQDGEPFVERTLPLPSTDADGRYHGYQPGWRSEAHAISVDATRDVNVTGTVLASFALDQPDIPLQQIVDAGPPTGLFVATAQTFFIARSAGVYGFSVRLARAGTQSADCLVRLGSVRHRMVNNVSINTSGSTTLNYAPTRFQLEPGLFPIGVATGCWRGDRVLGAGDLTLMVQRPGEAALRSAAADELIRQQTPAQADVAARPPSR